MITTTVSYDAIATPVPTFAIPESSSPPHVPDEQAEAVITPSGGTLSVPSGGVTLSQGAVSIDLNLTVLTFPPNQLSEFAEGGDFASPASSIVSFLPIGFQFESPVTITININNTGARRDLSSEGRLAIHSEREDGGWEELAGSVFDAATGSVSVQTSSFQRRYTVFRIHPVASSTLPSPGNSTQGILKGEGDTAHSPATADVPQVDGDVSVHQRVSGGFASGTNSFQAVLDSEGGGLPTWILVMASILGGLCLCTVLTVAIKKRLRGSRDLSTGGNRAVGYDAQESCPCTGVRIVAECGFDHASDSPSSSTTSSSLPGVHGRVIPAAYPSFEVLAKVQQPHEFIASAGACGGLCSAAPLGGQVAVQGGEWGVVSATLAFGDEDEENLKH